MAANLDAVHLALRNRAKPALPAARAFENVAFIPTSGVPYAEEEFAPGGGRLFGAASGGTVEEEGLYVIRWFALANTATTEFSTALTTLLNLFRPGSYITAADGTIVRIRGDFIPRRSQITNPIAGRALSVVTIPWYVHSINPS